MSDDDNSGIYIGGAVVIGLLILTAIGAVVLHFVLEKKTAAARSQIEQRLQRYNPTTKTGPKAAVETALADTIDGSGIPKVKAVTDKVVMLAYGYQLSSPASEEIRLSSQKTNFSMYTSEMLQRPADEREWYRNVIFAVMLEKMLLCQGSLVLGVLSEATRDMSGSVGVVDLLERAQEATNLDDEECSTTLVKLSNEALLSGQGRTKYVICRALGLLFREPKMSDKTVDLIKQQSRVFAEGLDLAGLFTCAKVYPMVYEVIERVIQLRTPEDARRPSTKDVVEHLLESGDEDVYLAYLLHVKKLPHQPYVPKEMVVPLLLLAKASPFHAGIVDEIFANNLRLLLDITARAESAPFVCLTQDIVNVMSMANKTLPDTCMIIKGDLSGMDEYRHLISGDERMMDWMEEQQALYRKKAVKK